MSKLLFVAASDYPVASSFDIEEADARDGPVLDFKAQSTERVDRVVPFVDLYEFDDSLENEEDCERLVRKIKRALREYEEGDCQ